MVERTWTATDACGNSTSAIQLISVQDQTPAALVCPNDVTLEWVPGIDVSTDVLGFATATDLCDLDPDITYSDSLFQGNCAANFVIERTWTALDECGNISRCVQTITVQDTENPIISCPADTAVEWVADFDSRPRSHGLCNGYRQLRYYPSNYIYRCSY